MSAVDQDGQLHRLGAAQLTEGVESGPDRAAGEEHVVDEHDDGVVDAAIGQLGAAEPARGAQAEGRRGTW